MRVFVVCPVRQTTADETEAIAAYVAALEAQGISVHWPPRDTPQGGDGVTICQTNRAAIATSDEVHIWWREGSQGSLFDLGMAFALGKAVRLARPVAATPGKSFANLLRYLGAAA